MPVLDREDARDVDELLGRALAASGASDTVATLRSLFVEKLDFDRTSGVVTLADQSLSVEVGQQAPRSARRIAARIMGQVITTARVLD